MDARAATWSEVERVARDAYGRLVASLAYRWNDIAAAEDALADALSAALTHWPARGIPESPEGWLIASAKNRLREVARHRAVIDGAAPAVLAMIEDEHEARGAAWGIDHRLHLMFTCAHPAIDESVRTPLMLQAVLGLDAARIASAFVVSPATMSQRLVRAKQKIHDARIPFDPPDPEEMPQRLGAVLEGIYAAFGTGWNDTERFGAADAPLVEEALFLARLTNELVGDEPEAMGLLALMTFSHARRRARFVNGVFVPLTEQDVALWDRSAIESADALLLRAASYRTPGHFQLEAAIQSAHCQRLFSGITPWRSIALLHEALDRIASTVATRVAHAVAVAEAGDPRAAHALLESTGGPAVASYQPYWVALAHILRMLGEPVRAKAAISRALELTTLPILRAHLERD